MKFSVLRKDYRAALLEEIDADQLPIYLGGSCQQCGGNCFPYKDGGLLADPESPKGANGQPLTEHEMPVQQLARVCISSAPSL
jgi:hypothetical protein